MNQLLLNSIQGIGLKCAYINGNNKGEEDELDVLP
jgi:hypothetical protein